MRNTSGHMLRFRCGVVGHFAARARSLVVVVVIVVVIVVVVLFVMPITVLSVDDHFFVLAVLLVMVRMFGLGVNPAGRRREDEISNREYVL